MKKKEEHSLIIATEKDNVGIIVYPEGVKQGDLLRDGIRASQNIPIGHKISLRDIDRGEAIIKYGYVIGLANTVIRTGEWVNESNTLIPDPPPLNTIPLQKKEFAELEPLEGYSFEGYRNPDGSVGTRNVLGITTSVQCVAGFTQHIVDIIKKNILPKYPNVDDVVAITHSYGCGIAIDAPAAMIPIKTLWNIADNPNFGGEVLVIGLGCEKLLPEWIIRQDKDSGESTSNNRATNIMVLQDEMFSGFQTMVEEIISMAEIKLEKLNGRKREPCSASELVVGVQCGGSDGLSGITANPVVGFATDLITRAGGSVVFSEVTEVRDAVHFLVPRTIDHEVARTLVDVMEWYDSYLAQGKSDRSANWGPGNRMGGLSNIVEKALGSVLKSGTGPIMDVLRPGEKIRRNGLTFAATPANDFVCGTLQVAAGMNVHVFTTGRGTPYGLAMVPVLKVGSNSKLSEKWFDLIDLDAGAIALGKKTIEDVGWELFHLILDVASGRRTVACDRLGLHNDLVLFNPGPLT